MSRANPHDPSTWSDGAWHWWINGYQRGVLAGIEIGRAEAEKDIAAAWAEVAHAVRDQGRTGRFKPPGRTVPYPEPPKTVDEIKIGAVLSWLQVENEIAAKRGAA